MSIETELTPKEWLDTLINSVFNNFVTNFVNQARNRKNKSYGFGKLNCQERTDFGTFSLLISGAKKLDLYTRIIQKLNI